jgi:GntR family transcriptional regulator/MocR family aminotransferase
MRAEELLVALQTKNSKLATPYHRQVFEQVRGAVLEGRLRPGDKLPSTRELAASLGVARNTVGRAYDDLVAEGYLEGRVGSGSYVAPELELPLESSRIGNRQPAAQRRAKQSGFRPPAHWQQPPAWTSDCLPYDFRPGVPDWAAFPRKLWLRLISRAMRTNAVELGRYGEPAGYLPLRRAIARHLAISRGVAACAEQVVIVSGSQQALDLIARLSLPARGAIALEDPGYPEARSVLSAAASRAVFVPVDDEGLDVAALTRLSKSCGSLRLVYVTPSHQFPTGATLSLSRRLALLDWAARRAVLIIEDDYDSEFRAPGGRPIESLQGLDRGKQVLYVGTFSTLLFPPLRVGYVVLPPGMVQPFVQAKWLADRQTPTLEQLALTDFLEEGYFERHLRRMRRLVSDRRDTLRAAIQLHFDECLPQPRAGMHLMMRLPTSGSRLQPAKLEALVVAQAASQGVGVYPVAPCRCGPALEAALVLGYASMPEERIREGVAILAGVVNSCTGGAPGCRRSKPTGRALRNCEGSF